MSIAGYGRGHDYRGTRLRSRLLKTHVRGNNVGGARGKKAFPLGKPSSGNKKAGKKILHAARRVIIKLIAGENVELIQLRIRAEAGCFETRRKVRERERELSRGSQPSEGRKKGNSLLVNAFVFFRRKGAVEVAKPQTQFAISSRSYREPPARDRDREIVLLSRRATSLRVRVLLANLASIVALSLSDSPATSLQTDRCDTEGRRDARDVESSISRKPESFADGFAVLPFLFFSFTFSPSSLACLPGVKTESPSSGT